MEAHVHPQYRLVVNVSACHVGSVHMAFGRSASPEASEASGHAGHPKARFSAKKTTRSMVLQAL